MPPFSCESNENSSNTVLMFRNSTPDKDEHLQNEDETIFATLCSPFQCFENSLCLDVDSFSSFLDWMGIKDDAETHHLNNNLNKELDCINFASSSSDLRAPSFSFPNHVNHDQFDNEYTSSHELLIDSLLEEARDRKLHLTLSDKQPSKNKLAKVSPTSMCVNPSSTLSSPCKSNPLSDLPPSKHEQSLIRKNSKKKVKVRKLLDRKRQHKQHFRDSPYQKIYDEPIYTCESSEDCNSRFHAWKSHHGGVDTNFTIDAINPDAILQKDKGFGNPLGKKISARGRSETLQKLREKMDIMIEVEDNRSSAVLKRVDAIEFQIDHETFETRSTIGIKMGFVSIRYGILLRWKLDGMVHFICLRKMCSDSFMKGPKRATKRRIEFSQGISNQSQNFLTEEQSRSSAFSFSSGLSDISNSLSFSSLDLEDLQQSSHISQTDTQESSTKTNIPLLQPPYLVPKPDSFPPATLEVTVLRARGLQVKIEKSKERIDSLVRVSIGEERYQTDLVRRSKNPVFGTKNGNNNFIFNCTKDTLLVEILDYRKPKQPRLIAFCNFPLSLVEARPANGHIPAKEVTLPCKMIRVPEGPNGSSPFGSISLSVIRRDAYTCWAKQELRERMNVSRKKQMWRKAKVFDNFKSSQ